MHNDITEEDQKRFWSKVNKQPGGTACWLWLGKGRIGRMGYGSIHIGSDTSATCAHRAGYRIQHGPIPKGQCVLHTCDVPLCVRGDHLFLGTRRQNAADRTTKRREARGSALPQAKLTETKVLELRRRYFVGEHPAQLAKEYGICLRGCWYVIQRKAWGWVCLPGESPAPPRDKHAPKKPRTYPKRHRVYRVEA